MKCPRCSTENLDGNAYCSGCGQSLDPKLSALEASLTLRLDDRIKAAIEAKFKDAKLLEVEVAEGVAKRLTEWAKILGVFVAIPITLLALVLGLFGIKSYTEFTTKIDETKKYATEAVEKQLTEFKTASKAELDKTTADFKGHLEQASGEELAAIHTRGQELLQTIDKQVDESSAIRQIKQEVKDLKTKFTFLSDSSVPADVKSKLDSALQQYQAYLKKVGFKGDDDVDVRIGNDVPGAACYYDPTGNAGKPEIFINRDHASEPDLIFLEYARHVLLSERPTILSVASGKGGPNGENWNYYAINSGLARYYACSFHGQPMFGTDGARSNLRTPGRVINSAPDWKWSNVTGAELWGSLCWDVREVLDRDSADALLRETWFSLNENDPSNTLPHNFREQFLVRAEKIENGKFLSALKEILEQRGL